VKKGQNGRKSLRRLKPTVGCNASKRKRRRRRRRRRSEGRGKWTRKKTRERNKAVRQCQEYNNTSVDRERENKIKRKKDGNKRTVIETERSERTQGIEQSKGTLVRRDKYCKDKYETERRKGKKEKRTARKNGKINGSVRKGKLPNDLSKADRLSHITGHRVKQASEVSVRTGHVTTETGGVVWVRVGGVEVHVM
jgi:hypothetical protein